MRRRMHPEVQPGDKTLRPASAAGVLLFQTLLRCGVFLCVLLLGNEAPAAVVDVQPGEPAAVVAAAVAGGVAVDEAVVDARLQARRAGVLAGLADADGLVGGLGERFFPAREVVARSDAVGGESD